MNRSDLEGATLRKCMTVGPLMQANTAVPAAVTTAGNVTYTVAQILSGFILRDPNGAARTDSLPTAALLVAGISPLAVGTIVSFTVMNASDGAADAENITIAAGAGGAFDAAQVAAARVVRTQSSRMVSIRFTNVSVGTEAYVVYM